MEARWMHLKITKPLQNSSCFSKMSELFFPLYFNRNFGFKGIVPYFEEGLYEVRVRS